MVHGFAVPFSVTYFSLLILSQVYTKKPFFTISNSACFHE